ncbi:MAG: Fic family protein [Gemmatimonadota bacterium]
MSEGISRSVNAFHGRRLPEPALPVGYGALMDRYGLSLPFPPRLAGIAERHNPQSTKEWLLLTPKHAPRKTLAGHLEFALKWEGVRLAVLTALFRAVPADEIARLVRDKPTGIYARRIWFLYEWLMARELEVPDAGKVRSVPVIDPDQQFAMEDGEISSRHKVVNNLPGTREFCPLVWRTELLADFCGKRLDERARDVMGQTHPVILARAAAVLLLDDSRASFRIEGERPSRQRAIRWAQAIGEAGSQPLSIEELERLQRIVIGDARFVHLGLRDMGGFVGRHDRQTGEPIPEHISARPEDLQSLLGGLVEYSERSVKGGVDAVIAASAIAFGFVYIHPFEDGNGRLHRWLIHHALAKAAYNPAGVVFPISAAILRRIADYEAVLQLYSKPLLPFIDWQPTDSGNVEVLNDTADYYRYFDATAHAEFLYGRVEETIERDLPAEVAYLEAYERFSAGVQQLVDMPEPTVNLLHRFLEQGEGRLSQRARTREFGDLQDVEVDRIQRLFQDSFADIPEVLKE